MKMKTQFNNSMFLTGRLLGLIALFLITDAAMAQQQKVILLIGAPGEEEYNQQFESWADGWQAAIETSNKESAAPADNPDSDEEPNSSSDQNQINLIRIGNKPTNENGGSDVEQLQQAIESTDESTGVLWLVLIGHGTDDRKRSKFNLRGKDVTAAQINDWLQPFPNRVVVINCASASGGFIAKLKAPNRIVITSTKSPVQYNFSRFGRYLAEAISDPTLDLDKDQETSLLEAFIAASARTQEFYVQETRLATELAMIDDNGDGKGTPGDWFQGTRVTKRPKKGLPDGLSANQVFLVRRGLEAQLSESARQKRDELEARLEQLRGRKKGMTEEAYYEAMEPILLDLAKIYREAEKVTPEIEKPAKQPEITPEQTDKSK